MQVLDRVKREGIKLIVFIVLSVLWIFWGVVGGG